MNERFVPGKIELTPMESEPVPFAESSRSEIPPHFPTTVGTSGNDGNEDIPPSIRNSWRNPNEEPRGERYEDGSLALALGDVITAELNGTAPLVLLPGLEQTLEKYGLPSLEQSFSPSPQRVKAAAREARQRGIIKTRSSLGKIIRGAVQKITSRK